MKKFNGTKGMIILTIMVLLVVGYYFYLSNRTTTSTPQETEVETLTQSQEVLLRNLDSNYPPTPREVVIYFGEISKAFYNEPHEGDELKELGLKMRQIYDDELVANQTQEQYLDLLQKDVDEYIANKRTLASFSPSSSVDVEKWSENGYEWARLYCIFDINQDGILYHTNTVFILRKDENSHYKIYGWKKVDE